MRRKDWLLCLKVWNLTNLRWRGSVPPVSLAELGIEICDSRLNALRAHGVVTAGKLSGVDVVFMNQLYARMPLDELAKCFYLSD